MDVGGTFTDLVLCDSVGSVFVFKAPSVPTNPANGVIAALELAAKSFSCNVDDILKNCELFVHGSTIATNTLLERKGASVGLITTEGFRDSLEIRRGWRDDVWSHREPFPPVLVPRSLRFPIRGRINADGSEYAPLSEADLNNACIYFKQKGIESIAICLFNSFVNADHELYCAQLFGQNWDWVSVSSNIAPVIGEYERTSTAVINAYIAPRTAAYLKDLNIRLNNLGLKRSILLTQNNGGVIPLERSLSRPVSLLLSGPAAGVGALSYYRKAVGSENLISMEIGGTSCDAFLMHRGEVEVSDEIKVEGYPLALPSVDIYTIGAGGGTIAGVDQAGLLFVGPMGAGADPGPACYGLGGTSATVTDALLVMGLLRPGSYAGGAVSLDKNFAEKVIRQSVADPLGINLEAAASGIIRLLEQNLLHALQKISIQRGHDPREFVLVVSGGAGPMHGSAVGRMLGCKKVYIPRFSGTFCAFGMLHNNLRLDFVRTRLDRLDLIQGTTIKQIYETLEEQAALELTESGAPTIKFNRQMDLRYTGQIWDVRIPIESDLTDKTQIRKSFEAEYKRLFGHIQPDGILEITALRVVGTGLLPVASLSIKQISISAPVPTELRTVLLNGTWQPLPVFKGKTLYPGHSIEGPALIEEDTTTILVEANDKLNVDGANNFVINLTAAEV